MDKRTQKTDPDRRVNRLWHLYLARVGAMDPNSDLRSLDKICRDELAVASAALKVFEKHVGEVR